MTNLLKIKKMSKGFYLLFTILMAVIPLYYILFWVCINHLPETLISNVAPESFLSFPLSIKLRLLGFTASLLPLSALIYGVANLRRLFSFYKQGTIFSMEHARIFRKVAKALVLWCLFSILYEAAQSVLFSISNPPGSRVISVGVSSFEVTTLIVAGIALFTAWVMDEGRILSEENELTV